jgi:hypothetical protein
MAMVALPSEIHPSYPYGNPFSLTHPAALPRNTRDFTSRALYEDMDTVFGSNSALLWKDLALDELLPVDKEEELRLKAEHARKMANGAQANNTAGSQQQVPENEGDDIDADGEVVDDDEGEWEEEPSNLTDLTNP